MNIGIVTTWFERGAAYVSKQFEQALKSSHVVFIYGRGGELQAKKDPNWNAGNVHWGKKIYSPFLATVIDKKDFIRWIKQNNIEVVLFNEQHWWMPILWCRQLGVKTVCYVDYYKKETLSLFANYDLLICNTERHMQAFHFIADKTVYLPWGTNVDLYQPGKAPQKDCVVFFHSCGMDPYRKGTDLVLKAFNELKSPAHLVIHTQVSVSEIFPHLNELIKRLENEKRLEVIQKTVHAPGLFYMGDVYVYPSRLEGVGLTIAEALASGLACIVPDNGPMNEFVTDECGALIKIAIQYCRQDAYYWPECEIDTNHLTEIMENMAQNPQGLSIMKANARQHALEKLNWKINSAKIKDVFNNLNLQKIDNQLSASSIIDFENRGKRKIINNLVPYHRLLKLLKNVLPA